MPYFITSTFLFIAALIIIYWLHNQYHLDVIVTPAPPPVDAPLISICIPARNEERNIRACVESALAQDYPNLEILVLDDRSHDQTPAILQNLASGESRLSILRGSDLPSGWAGKPHALFQVAQSARGQWLCFVDADTTVNPELLRAVVQAVRQGAVGGGCLARFDEPPFWGRMTGFELNAYCRLFKHAGGFRRRWWL